MNRCKNKEELINRACKILGISEAALREGLRIDKFNFGVSFPITGKSDNVFIDEYSLKLVEEGKISPFKGGWSLP